MKKKIYITGHINPDTDSVCAAAVYAYIKNTIDPEHEYIACRAGRINDETEFALNYFASPVPRLIEDVRTQVKDISFRTNTGVSEETSLRAAWELVKERNIVTLPVAEDEHFKGLLTVKDLGRVYLDNNRSDLISEAKTLYQSAVDVLDGKIITDNGQERFLNGRVIIAAAEADTFTEYVDEDAIVIVSNREELQRVAIKHGASCLIVTIDAPVSKAIRELAAERGCLIISTPYDTYVVARLLNQSIPVRFAMRSEGIVSFSPDDYLEDVKKVMSKTGYRDFPVIDPSGKFTGMISRRFLLDADRKRVILVDHNERSQAVRGIGEAEILEIIDHHRLGNIETFDPVYFRNQPVGSTSTIISQIAIEKGVALDKVHAGLLCAGIISDTLLFSSPTTTQADRDTANMLAKIAGIDIEKFASDMFRAGNAAVGKSPEEMMLLDFKSYKVEDSSIGISQINFMDDESLKQAKDLLITSLEETRKKQGLDLIFVLLTNIPTSNSVVLFDGEDAGEIIEAAFEKPTDGSTVVLEGVVSRKKQFLPELLSAMQG